VAAHTVAIATAGSGVPLSDRAVSPASQTGIGDGAIALVDRMIEALVGTLFVAHNLIYKAFWIDFIFCQKVRPIQLHREWSWVGNT
jgi:hypothetical protein